MLECLFKIETLTSGTMQAFSNAINTMIEECDHENLQEPLRSICEKVYTHIQEHLANRALTEGLNAE